MVGLTSIQSTVVLNNGVQMPCMGFDTRDIAPAECTQAVLDAIAAGYRFITTASFYGNEEAIGQAVKSSTDVPREQLFIASRAADGVRGYDATMSAIKVSLAKLGLDALDLYLVHLPTIQKVDEPVPDEDMATWKAMEDAYKDGLVRAIGVCGLSEVQLHPLMHAVDIEPMVDEIEMHPRCNQPATVNYCRHHGIIVEAWLPLGTGSILNSPVLIDIAAKYSVTPEQLCLRWCLQRGAVPLPSTTDSIQMSIDADVFRFTISGEDMALINALDPYGMSGLAPETRDN